MSQRRLRRIWALVPFAAALGPVAAGCGADNALVGGSCAAPFSQCGAECVNLLNDPENCGTCGLACSPGSACEMGECLFVPTDGSSTDAARDGTSGSDGSLQGDSTMPEDAPVGDSSEAGDAPSDGASSGDGTLPDGVAPDGSVADAANDAGGTDGTAADGTVTDGGAVDSAAGDSSGDEGSDAACMVPFDTPAQCGNCTTACGDAAPVCAPSGSTYVCAATCAPLQDCGGTCVDETSDALNCGGCGIVCPSQICLASLCVGSTTGSLVFIGHDYSTTIPGTAQARVLSNAVFLWPADPVHVLSYERYADPTAIGRIHSIVAAGATGLGRTVDITSTNTDSDIPNTLKIQTYGVLLVADQVNAQGDVDLGALGNSWGQTLTTFTAGGGVVIILDGGTGAGQMPSLASGTGLLSVTAQAILPTNTALYLLAPSDSLSIGVLSPYAAGANSVTITTEANQGSVDYVFAPAVDSGAPVSPTVVHKVF